MLKVKPIRYGLVLVILLISLSGAFPRNGGAADARWTAVEWYQDGWVGTWVLEPECRTQLQVILPAYANLHWALQLVDTNLSSRMAASSELTIRLMLLLIGGLIVLTIILIVVVIVMFKKMKRF